MQFGAGLSEILVWTAGLLRYLHPDAGATSNTPQPFQLPPTFESTPPHPQHKHPNHHPSHNFDPNFNPNNHLTTDITSTPPCTFHQPLQSSSSLNLPHQTWVFLTALLSHRIQALHQAGESVMDTIPVKDALLAFENSEELKELDVGIAEVFDGVEGLYVGLVYGGRGDAEDGGVEEERRVDVGVKGCVENAIRNTYETRQLSGWMNLEGANDAENEDGEWVSYLIYQGDEI